MKIRLVIGLLVVLFLASCGGAKKKIVKENRKIPKHPEQSVSKPKDNKDNNVPVADAPNIDELPNPLHQKATGNTAIERYVSLYKEVAIEEMGTYGIPASITLAQGILESGNGNSDLTRRSNNHFGIKCHDWVGERVYHDDDRRKECFRKYDNPNYSYRDHSLFLRNRSRYNQLFKLSIEDYKGWARGLKAAGYATDPRYPKKLIALIENNELYKYDKEAIKRFEGLKNGSKANHVEEQNAEIYIVKKGDTLYSISKRYGLSVDALKQQNNLQSNYLSVGQHLNVSN